MTHSIRHPGLVPGSSVRHAGPPETPFVSLAERCTPERVRSDGGKWAAVKSHFGLAALFTLAACGKAAGLTPAPGQQLPVAPIGAKATPTPTELLIPTMQQRPQRGDDLLKSSQERRSDEFDLPPQ